MVLDLFLFVGFGLSSFSSQACAFWDHLILVFETSFFLEVFVGDFGISMTCALGLSFSFHFLRIEGKAWG
jgi:hypothetical protein